MDEASTLVGVMQNDLQRKYKPHAAPLETIWRSLGKRQGAKCLKDGVADGAVLKHASDRSLGSVCLVVPELNLRDIADSGLEFLLDSLKDRATKSLLFEQYCEGVKGVPGDYEFIHISMRSKGLRHANDFEDSYSWFVDDENMRSLSSSKPITMRSSIALNLLSGPN